MLSPISERETIKDLERMVWLHFQGRAQSNRHTAINDQVGGLNLSLFGDRVLVRGTNLTSIIQFERRKNPKTLSHYNYPTCAQLLTELKRLHPLEALADI